MPVLLCCIDESMVGYCSDALMINVSTAIANCSTSRRLALSTAAVIIARSTRLGMPSKFSIL